MSENTSVDDFLDHGFSVVQFKSGGHRSGIDAILLAACVNEKQAGIVADFGAGVGVVGMAVAHRCQNIHANLFEIDEDTVELFYQSIQLSQNAHLRNRIRMHCLDVADPVAMQKNSQLPANSIDHVLMNPPFNDVNHRSSPGEKRAIAHVLELEAPERWTKSAATLCKANGKISIIIRPENLIDFLEPIKKRFGAIKVLPIQPKHDVPAKRVLIGGTKGSRGALQICPPLVLHEDDGVFTSEAEDILRGRAGIPLHG